MSQTATGTGTLAQQLHASPAVAQAIDQIIDDVVRAQSQITAVRGPSDSTAELRYIEMLKDSCSVRGKSKLFFDYIGSGLGNGPFVELADGSVKLDMICGIGVHFFGHSDPEGMRTALRAAMGDTPMQGNLQQNAEATEFARVIVEQASKGSNLKYAFLSNSGAMANESALKVCFQKAAPASRVIAFDGCFMGRSVTMCQIGDSSGNRAGVPLSTLVDYLPFYDPAKGDASIDETVDLLKKYIARYPGQHAALIVELTQGEGGFNSAPREFFVRLMETARDAGIPVWDDEVQTFGRTGEMFAYQTLNLGEYIDVVTIGKMSQVCACLYTEAFNPRPGLLSGTFIGSTMSLQVGLNYITRLRDGDYYGPNGKIAAHRTRFIEGVRALADAHPEWFGPALDKHGHPMDGYDIVGGLGGMMRFTPFGGRKAPVTELLHTLFREGVIAFYCGHDPYHIRFLPPLGVMELSHWDAVFEVVERSLAKVAENHVS